MGPPSWSRRPAAGSSERLADPGHPGRGVLPHPVLRQAPAHQGRRARPSPPSAPPSSCPSGPPSSGSSGSRTPGTAKAPSACIHSVGQAVMPPRRGGGHDAVVAPVDRVVDVVAVGRRRVQHRHATSTASRWRCSSWSPSSRCSCTSSPIEYMKGDIRFTHYFAVPLPVHRRDAEPGRGREHDPAPPRLGDHGPLLVRADRALVGGEAQLQRRPQGVLHHPHRRHRPAGGHLDPVLRSRAASASWPPTVGAVARRPPRRCCCGRRSRCSSPSSARPASSRCTPGCPTPWPARRPVSALIHAATMVVAGVYLGRPPLPGVLGGLQHRRRRGEPDGAHRRHHHPDRRACWRSCRSTSRRCWPTPPSASSATW